VPPPKTRLDPLVKLKERAEERARRNLAKASQDLALIQSKLDQLRQLAAKDSQVSGSAADWELRDVAHARALSDIRKAEEGVAAAARREQTAREAYGAAYRELDAIRRAAEARRSELMLELETRERKELDELGQSAFTRKK
jgi:flagellar export protein FliJ